MCDLARVCSTSLPIKTFEVFYRLINFDSVISRVLVMQATHKTAVCRLFVPKSIRAYSSLLELSINFIKSQSGSRLEIDAANGWRPAIVWASAFALLIRLAMLSIALQPHHKASLFGLARLSAFNWPLSRVSQFADEFGKRSLIELQLRLLRL